jgi:hypothetical protein
MMVMSALTLLDRKAAIKRTVSCSAFELAFVFIGWVSPTVMLN